MRSAAEKNPQTKVYLIFFMAAFALQTGADTIIDRDLTVIRGDFKEVHYLIPPGAENAKLQGSFTAKGGFYDDINFFVFTKDQYVRWYSNYSNKPIFKLEKKKEGKFEVPVVVGETYYFVLDNFFSTVSNKQVKIQVQLVPRNK